MNKQKAHQFSPVSTIDDDFSFSVKVSCVYNMLYMWTVDYLFMYMGC